MVHLPPPLRLWDDGRTLQEVFRVCEGTRPRFLLGPGPLFVFTLGD